MNDIYPSFQVSKFSSLVRNGFRQFLILLSDMCDLHVLFRGTSSVLLDLKTEEVFILNEIKAGFTQQ